MSAPTQSRVEKEGSSCETDPIHLIGAIQSFGVLLALNDALQVTHVSANAHRLWPKGAHGLIGQPLGDIFRPPLPHALLQSCLRLREGQYKNSGIKVQLDDALATWDLCWQRQSGRHILELEPQNEAEADDAVDLLSLVEEAVSALHAAGDLDGLMQTLTRQVRDILGYDRVMIYRFDRQWNGSVMAQSLVAKARSFLGQHFPASDIPAPARAAFVVKRLRIIPNVDAQDITIIERAKQGSDPLDLSRSTLRASAAIHLQWLRNMGVAASLTLSLVKDGILWGLVTCHHLCPRMLTRSQRQAVELLCSTASQLLTAKENASRSVKRSRNRRLLKDMEKRLWRDEHLLDNLASLAQDILALFDTSPSSLAILIDGTWHTHGQVPDRQQLAAVVRWLNDRYVKKEIYCNNHFIQEFPEALAYKDTMAGILAILFPKIDDTCVLILRPEVVRSVSWAGSPNKPLVPKEATPSSQSTRDFFKNYEQKVELTATPFDASERENAQRLRKLIIERDLQRQVEREKKLRRRMQEQEQRSAFLSGLSQLLSETRGDDELTQKVAQYAVQTFCDSIVVYRQIKDTFERVVIASMSLDDTCMDELPKSPAIQDVLGKLVRPAFVEQRPQLIVNVHQWLYDAQDRGVASYRLWQQKYFEAASLLLIPIAVPHGAPGVLKMMRKRSRSNFSPSDLKMAVEMGKRFSSALENAALYEKSQQAVLARDQILSVVSHDLRNPLSAISLTVESSRKKLKAHIEKAADAPRPAAMHLEMRSLDRIDMACQRMNSLILDLLNLAKIEAGHFAIDLQPVDAKELLQQSLSILEPLAQSKKVNLAQAFIAPSATFLGDRERLLQVMSNLIGNAIKFTPAGGDITLGLESTHAGLSFWVKDTGCGISQDMLPHIFERFWQAPNTHRHGAGLGLAIAKGIVEAHGGRMGVTSHINQGTCITFTIAECRQKQRAPMLT